MTPAQAAEPLSPAANAHAIHQIVVMGVAGCGKSTLGQSLAVALGLAFIEGDAFHPPENLHKMAQGIALQDADRYGWLDRLAAQMRGQPQGAVLSCSALKRAYRERLRAAVPALRFVHLSVPPDLANARVAARAAEHLFPPSLVASQFAALQDPCGEAGVLQLDGALALAQLSGRAAAWLAAQAANADTP